MMVLLTLNGMPRRMKEPLIYHAAEVSHESV
jgi:hypothetical protein